MKAKTLQVENETTVGALLQKEFGMDSKLYFTSVNGNMATPDTIVKPQDEVKAIPMVKGG